MQGAAFQQNAAPARAVNPPAVCTVQDCGGKHVARGLCDRHYRHWAILNPNTRQAKDIPDRVESFLPATQEKLIEKTGYNSETVRRAIALLRREGRAHVGDFQPPTTPGTRFMPIFYPGEGEDMKVTAKMRRDQKNKTAREGHNRRRIQWQLQTLPKAASWAATLFVRQDVAWQKNPARAMQKMKADES
jgi:hypothetical protein